MKNFYNPEEIKPLYDEIVPAYQAAFAGYPWNEVSKCVDTNLRCPSGLSNLPIGSQCSDCGFWPTSPAYETNELVERFEQLGSSRPTAWYVEQNDVGTTLATIAWKATTSFIAKEKYADVPEINPWLKDRFSSLSARTDDPEIMWLDEVFANKQIKPNGNLKNFGKFVTGLAQRLDCKLVAYRTIEPRMTAVAQRDFGRKATILERGKDVPDRRDFVIINIDDARGQL